MQMALAEMTAVGSTAVQKTCRGLLPRQTKESEGKDCLHFRPPWSDYLGGVLSDPCPQTPREQRLLLPPSLTKKKKKNPPSSKESLAHFMPMSFSSKAWCKYIDISHLIFGQTCTPATHTLYPKRQVRKTPVALSVCPGMSGHHSGHFTTLERIHYL